MPPAEILRGDAALEEYLGLPRGALAKRRLHGRPVPPGIRLPQGKSRFYVLEDVMAWLRAHREPEGIDRAGVSTPMSAQRDSVSLPPRPRGRPRKGTPR